MIFISGLRSGSVEMQAIVRKSFNSSRNLPNRWLTGLLACLGLAGWPAALAAEEPATTEAPEEPAPLTPEEFFEGGAQPYTNWVELAVGGWIPSGNTKQLQQRQGETGRFAGARLGAC